MGRQLEVSLWMENKGMPPDSPKPSKSPKKDRVLALHTWVGVTTGYLPEQSSEDPQGSMHPVPCFPAALTLPFLF